jgi:photosystem II stability/assembly factor-like uncharacterized protein
MNKPCRLLSAVALIAFLPRAYPAQAQLLSPTSAPSASWISLAASADGAKLAAVGSYGWLYLSTNSGSNWTPAVTAPQTPEPERPWTSVASSANGDVLVAVANFVPIFCSTNGGMSWNQSGPAGLWSGAAASADGNLLIAADHNDGFIYLSKDRGITWVPSGAPKHRWRSVCASAEGSKLFATSDFGTNYGQVPELFVSTNSGVSWRSTGTLASPCQGLVSSADGKKVAAGSYGGPVYLSSDSGEHWTSATLPDARWGGLAGSADGTRLFAAAAEGFIYISNDSGRTWTKANAPEAPWQTVACSSDGLRLFAASWGGLEGGIYTTQLLPRLGILVSPGGLIISWPGSAQGFALEQNSDITTRNWLPVNTLPITTNGQNQVVFRDLSGTSAFRLVRQ